MLRQIHIFIKSELIFVKDYAMALGNEELQRVKQILQKYIEIPVHGKTLTNHISNFQIFHRASNNFYLVFITDISDSLQYIESLMLKAITKFEKLFPNPQDIKEPSSTKSEFIKFLDQLQKELHSKIAIIGPMNSGKSTLYDILKTDNEKVLMDFVKITQFQVNDVSFDLWDFQLRDHFSLLWSKIIAGSDLVILVFNLANFHVKIIKHFLDLQKLEGKYSKLLIIGNKRDLVDDNEIKRIKNELNIEEFIELSLNSPDAKTEIIRILMDTLGLKKKFPSDFGARVKEAGDLVQEGKTVQGLAKFKELIIISKAFQNIIYTKALEQKISDLNKKIKEQTEKRRTKENKKEFTVSKSLMFTRKISVKPLPSQSAMDDSIEQKPSIEEKFTTPSKPLKKMVAFQQLDSKKVVKPPKIPKKPSKLIVKPKIPKTISPSSKSVKSIKPKDLHPKMPLELFSPNEEITKEIEKPKVIDFPRELQKFIEKGGSSLSPKLCEHLIIELKKSLDRPISFEDVKMAANFFVKQEQLE